MRRRNPLSRDITWRKRSVRFTGPMPDVVEAVLERASLQGFLGCEVCGDSITGERGWDWSLHHRRGRDGKPDSHMPQNLLLVHGASNVDACHGRIHRNREGESRLRGWLIGRNSIPSDPLLVPALLCAESAWCYLDDLGGYADNPPVVTAV